MGIEIYARGCLTRIFLTERARGEINISIFDHKRFFGLCFYLVNPSAPINTLRSIQSFAGLFRVSQELDLDFASVSMHASAIRLYTRRLPTQYLCQRRRFSSRHYDATGGYLARSASTVLSVACAGIAGWAFYHTSSGKERTESRSVPQDDTDGVAELVSDLDWKFKAVLPYIVKTASAALRLNEMDSLGNVNSGVRRFYSARHAANVPIEDDLATTSTELFHGGVWSFWGIYDGHAYGLNSRLTAHVVAKFGTVAQQRRPC